MQGRQLGGAGGQAPFQLGRLQRQIAGQLGPQVEAIGEEALHTQSLLERRDHDLGQPTDAAPT